MRTGFQMHQKPRKQKRAFGKLKHDVTNIEPLGGNDNAFNSIKTYHTPKRSATFCGLLIGTIWLLVSLDARGENIEILASGELQFGLSTAADEQLSDDGTDRGYAFFAESELYIDANVSPSM